ncbi:hypothetical protein D3C75_1260120 [compost metagenome]
MLLAAGCEAAGASDDEAADGEAVAASLLPELQPVRPSIPANIRIPVIVFNEVVILLSSP